MAIQAVIISAEQTAAMAIQIGIIVEDRIVVVLNMFIHVAALLQYMIVAVWIKWIAVVV